MQSTDAKTSTPSSTSLRWDQTTMIALVPAKAPIQRNRRVQPVGTRPAARSRPASPASAAQGSSPDLCVKAEEAPRLRLGCLGDLLFLEE